MTLEQLEHDLAALPTDEAYEQPRDANRHRRAALEASIETVRASNATLANVVPQIAAKTKWRDFLTTARQTLCDELLAGPPHAHSAHERGTKRNLELSIRTIDRGLPADTGWALETLRLGDLMRESVYVEGPRIENQIHGELPWFGSMPEVERRLKALQQQRDDAQARLDAALRDSVPV